MHGFTFSNGSREASSIERYWLILVCTKFSGEKVVDNNLRSYKIVSDFDPTPLQKAVEIARIKIPESELDPDHTEFESYFYLIQSHA